MRTRFTASKQKKYLESLWGLSWVFILNSVNQLVHCICQCLCQELHIFTVEANFWICYNNFRFGVLCGGEGVVRMHCTTIFCCEQFVIAVLALTNKFRNYCCQLSRRLLGGKLVSQMLWNTNKQFLCLITVIFSHQCRYQLLHFTFNFCWLYCF